VLRWTDPRPRNTKNCLKIVALCFIQPLRRIRRRNRRKSRSRRRKRRRRSRIRRRKSRRRKRGRRWRRRRSRRRKRRRRRMGGREDGEGEEEQEEEEMLGTRLYKTVLRGTGVWMVDTPPTVNKMKSVCENSLPPEFLTTCAVNCWSQSCRSGACFLLLHNTRLQSLGLILPT
jgi:polynucleotide 5'-kinase involved in rRNA processing